jgi:hypothetical protein
MALKASTGLRNGMLASGSLKSLMDGSLIKIYAGPTPASADDAIGTAVLLCTVSKNGTGDGVSLAASAENGSITKDPTEVWSGLNLASGTATFWRMCRPTDDNSSATDRYRIQGTAATAGAELVMTSVTLVQTAPQYIDFFAVALPG